jgi:class 3 adenylate cyclase
VSVDADLVHDALQHTGGAFADDAVRLGILRQGILDFGSDRRQLRKESWKLLGTALEVLRMVDAPLDDGGQTIVAPLLIGGTAAGALVAERSARPFSDADRVLLDLLASRVAVAVENTRLYRQLNGLFRQFMPADVAAELVADPDQAALGGEVREVSILFADLRGFTSFSERSSPEQVVAMLNRYFAVAVPVVISHGGTVTTFIGDALMALFNAPSLQEDHAERAARAGLAMQAEIEAIVESPDAPRFRVGVNTGPALVGNIGSPQRRTYTAIGDAVNLAARLEPLAPIGKVVIGPATYAAIAHMADVDSLGHVQVKGKAEAIEAFALHGLSDLRRFSGTQVIRIPRKREATT